LFHSLNAWQAVLDDLWVVLALRKNNKSNGLNSSPRTYYSTMHSTELNRKWLDSDQQQNVWNALEVQFQTCQCANIANIKFFLTSPETTSPVDWEAFK
jgi:hypothetical protein